MNITKVGVIDRVIGKTHLAALHGQPDFQIVGPGGHDPPRCKKRGRHIRTPGLRTRSRFSRRAGPDYVASALPFRSCAAGDGRWRNAASAAPVENLSPSGPPPRMRPSRPADQLPAGGEFQHAAPRPACQAAAVARRKTPSANWTRVTMAATAWFRSMFYYRSSPWRAPPGRGEGGGILVNQAPHDLDLLIEMAGLPSEVLAEVATVGHAIEVEDSVSAVLKWDNGLRGMLHVNTNEYPGRTMFELAGTRGAIILEPKRLTMSALHGDTREISDHAGDRKARPEMDKTIVWDDPPDQNRYLAMHRNFAAACRGDEQLICPAEDGLKEVELANAILISGIKGRPARLPSARDEFDGLLEELQEAGNLTAVKNRYAK